MTKTTPLFNMQMTLCYLYLLRRISYWLWNVCFCNSPSLLVYKWITINPQCCPSMWMLLKLRDLLMSLVAKWAHCLSHILASLSTFIGPGLLTPCLWWIVWREEWLLAPLSWLKVVGYSISFLLYPHFLFFFPWAIWASPRYLKATSENSEAMSVEKKWEWSCTFPCCLGSHL